MIGFIDDRQPIFESKQDLINILFKGPKVVIKKPFKGQWIGWLRY